MNIRIICRMVLLTLLGVGGTLYASEVPPEPVAEGIAVVSPVQDGSCLAVKVAVSEDQAVSGLKWFNGSADFAFSHALVASGAEDFPPPLTDAVSLADDVQGPAKDWAEITFTEPIASESGNLFLILQYPSGYASPDSATPLGVGYISKEGGGTYYMSSEGESWVKVASRCQLMLEPVYCLRDSTTLSKGMQRDEPDSPPLPKIFAVAAYPNPFNPQTTIEVSLPKATQCSVELFDLRGRLVRRLYGGYHEPGVLKLRWNGEDDRGQSSSSGLYFAVVKSAEKTINQRLVLIK